jgi:putative glycosyltransferase (TIGR04348 family)
VHSESILIVTPALADANNGNWQTARRWARMLAKAYRVRLATGWDGGGDDLMIALHARRSAPAIHAWKRARPRSPLLVVLTGTDLYRDIATDADAQASLRLADALVVLNAHGARELAPALRAKCHVVLQSCTAREPRPFPAGRLRALMVGHLREEKDPGTFLRAAARLADRADLRFDHVGAALDPALGAQAAALAASHPRYRWLGALPHEAARRRIQSAQVLVHASRMEGGAHVVIEALRSGTPVIASRIDGNLGLLGDDWPATFEVGDDAALVRLIAQARDDPAMLADLRRRALARSPSFDPAAERTALLGIVDRLLT